MMETIRPSQIRQLRNPVKEPLDIAKCRSQIRHTESCNDVRFRLKGFNS